MAAVVGVIANLSVWFALHVWFETVTRDSRLWLPDWASLDLAAVILTLLAAILLLWQKMGLIRVLVIMAGAGALISPFFG
jgi:chromate transporter